MTQIPLGGNYSIFSTTQMCTGSVSISSFPVNICSRYTNAGCAVSPQNAASTICIGSNYNATTGTCYVPPSVPSNIIIVGNGQQCGITSPAGITSYCGGNLQCLQNICRPQLQLGANCGGGLQCGYGLICNGDICAIPAQQIAQGPCKTSAFCREQNCNLVAGVCTEIRSIPCYSNADCPSTNEVCYIQSGILGTCTRGDYLIQSQIILCGQITGCIVSTQQYVSSTCQTQCLLRPDLRIVADGYVYDCTALTRTLQNTTCSYNQAIINCPSAPLSGAFVQGLSVFVFIFILSLFA